MPGLILPGSPGFIYPDPRIAADIAAAVTAHEAESDPHTGYATDAEITSILASIAALPQGELGYAEVTSNQGSITTLADLTSLSATVTVGTSRRIVVIGYIGVSVDTVSDTTAALHIRDGSTTLQTARNRPVGNSRQAVLQAVWVGSPSAGSWTPKLSLEREVGTGTLTMHAASTNPAFIHVLDFGAA